MRILIAGSSGFIGQALTARLRGNGHRVIRLLRQAPGAQEEAAQWDPASGQLDAGLFEGVEAVINLAGENIFQGRWTAAKKKRLRASRIDTTTLISQTIARLEAAPKIFIAASAIGYYGHRGEEELTEESVGGEGFLPEICKEWEAATRPAQEAGVRVVQLRIGVVLSPEGGALQQLLTPFKLGLGGRLGSGRAWMSWITLHDLLGAIEHTLQSAQLSGPVNGVSPNPVTNAQFTRALGRVLRRPALLPLPELLLKRAFGEMAQATLLASTRVYPRRLIESGFQFADPEIEAALQRLLRI